MRTFELPPKIHGRVTALCATGDEHAEAGRLEEALAAYTGALELLPDPTDRWEAAAWIFAAIGDVHFLIGSFEIAQKAFQEAIRCPNARGNAFLHLRLGQLALEHGQEEEAAKELGVAYRVQGEEIFASDDPKYLAFVQAQFAAE